MNLYQVDVTIHATAYIKASSEEEAAKLAENLKDQALEFPGDNTLIGDDIWLSGRAFDDAELPELSLSPAMTLHGANVGQLYLTEEGVPE